MSTGYMSELGIMHRSFSWITQTINSTAFHIGMKYPFKLSVEESDYLKKPKNVIEVVIGDSSKMHMPLSHIDHVVPVATKIDDYYIVVNSKSPEYRRYVLDRIVFFKKYIQHLAYECRGLIGMTYPIKPLKTYKSIDRNILNFNL
jgi:hypothetical protein